MSLPIKNAVELRNELYRLEVLEVQQADAIKSRFSSPGALFSTFLSLFPKSGDHEGVKSGLFHQDFIGLISRLVLPIALNKTLFKNSGFIVKTLVGLISQKASNYINEDSVSDVWDKAKTLFEAKVAHNPAITGIVDKVKSLFSKKQSKSRGRIKNAPVPAYVKAS
ncbi:MAG: hypothetical protein ABI367_05390 [Mucilaginibacter sp.]